jgi:hypothetical protein
MNGLYQIVQRKRRPLQTATMLETPPVVTVCPHCGRSSAETVLADGHHAEPESLHDLPPAPPADFPPIPAKTEPVQPVIKVPDIEPEKAKSSDAEIPPTTDAP